MANDVITALGHHARHTPTRTALRHGMRTLSYAELALAVEQMAVHVRAQGLKPNQAIVIWANKRIETVVVMLAAWAAHLVIVPLHPALRAAQVRAIFDRAEAQGLVVDRSHAQALGCGELLDSDWGYSASPDAPFKPLSFAAPTHLAPAPCQSRCDNNLAALMFTSGSTGLPKGVMVTHQNIDTGAAAVSQYLGLTAADELLAVLPLSFDYGLSQITMGLLVGAGITLHDYLLPNDLKAPLLQGGITVLAGTPGLLIPLSQAAWLADAPALRLLTNSGGKLPIASVHALRAARPHTALYLMYGLTEAFRASMLDPREVDAHPDSIGRAFSASALGIVDDHGAVIPPNQAGEGELVQGGPLVTQGYFNDPPATAARFKSPPVGWPNPADRVVVYSGDRVRRDAAGRYYFLGRLDEQFKVQGIRISPEEIERAALQQADVKEALAFGYPPHPASASEQTAVGLVVAPADVNLAALKSWLHTQLAPYQMPNALIALPALPRSNNGKLDRAASREALMQHLSTKAKP